MRSYYQGGYNASFRKRRIRRHLAYGQGYPASLPGWRIMLIRKRPRWTWIAIGFAWGFVLGVLI